MRRRAPAREAPASPAHEFAEHLLARLYRRPLTERERAGIEESATWAATFDVKAGGRMFVVQVIEYDAD